MADLFTDCKAVIFDLDGTLLDTISDLASSMNYTLEKFGFPVKELSHHAKSVGNGLRKYAERCIPKEHLTEGFLDEFVPVVAEHYRANSTGKTIPYDGIYELLDFLKQTGIMINILSNKRDDFVKELAQHYFSDYNFVCACGELPTVAKKPNPEAALLIADKCNVAPDKILFIGDSTYDIITGKNANMKTVAVTWGYQPESMLLAENPDFIAHKPQDIINYIKQNF